MNFLSRFFSTTVLVLALSMAAFASQKAAGHQHDFSKQNAVNFLAANETYTFAVNNFNGIPQEVLDPRFRQWQPPFFVPIYQNPNLPDIAVALIDGYGARIIINPVVASRIPPRVMAFFMAHEYGHIVLRTSNETACDEFAARAYAQTDINVVRAAIWWMMNFPNQGDATHPPTYIRAQNIARAAGL
jgi:hypothetical protein